MKQPKLYFRLLACVLALCVLTSLPQNAGNTDTSPGAAIIQTDADTQTEASDISPAQAVAACILVIILIIIIVNILGLTEDDNSA